MSDPEGLGQLRRVARRLLGGAAACLLLPILVLSGMALYERLVPATEMHPPGPMRAGLVLYLAPVGLVLLVLGLAARGWAWWLARAGGREDHPTTN